MRHTKATKAAANKTLASALREYGLTPNGTVWTEAKALVAMGLDAKASARLIRSNLPEVEQMEAIARAKAHAAKAKAPKREVVRSREVSNEEAADIMRKREMAAIIERLAKAQVEVEQAPISQGRLSSRAKDVKAGKVMRDAKGRLVSREVQEALAELNA